MGSQPAASGQIQSHPPTLQSWRCSNPRGSFSSVASMQPLCPRRQVQHILPSLQCTLPCSVQPIQPMLVHPIATQHNRCHSIVILPHPIPSSGCAAALAVIFRRSQGRPRLGRFEVYSQSVHPAPRLGAASVCWSRCGFCVIEPEPLFERSAVLGSGKAACRSHWGCSAAAWITERRSWAAG